MANEKILNTKIKLRYDSHESWMSNDPVLMEGELALSAVSVKQDGVVNTVPSVLIKCGDGEHKYSELGYVFARAADVIAAAKSEDTLRAFINGVIADAGIASDDAMQELAGRVTTAEGEIDALQADLNTAETGLKARVTTAEAAIDALEDLVGDKKVATQISEAITALNLANTYEAKGEAAKVQTALNEYKTSNDAAVLANTNAADANAKAIAAIKDGTAIDSFADVEAELAKKEAVGAAAQALADAKTYADGLAGNYDAKGAAATAESNAKAYAKEYADGLAGNYDAAGSAAQALTGAKAYTDSFTGGKTVSDSINTALANYSTTTQMNDAIATAKGEAVAHANTLNTNMNTRVEALEAIDHTHTFVEDELNLIKAGDVAKWNAAEQNAKDYADAEDAKIESRVADLEAKFTGDDSVADQIAAAVAAEAELREAADADLAADIKAISDDYLKAADKTALQDQIDSNDADILALQGLVGDTKVSEAIAAEAKLREDADSALDTRVKAIEDDYLKAADKEALQTQINTIMSNPDAEGVINSINEFTAYVTEHGTIADGMRTDINKNKDDIAAMDTAYKAADTALSGRLDVLEAIDNDAYVAADTALKNELNVEIAKKAAQTDLDNAVARIATAEGKITTLEGEMDAVEDRLDALDLQIGDGTVNEQILAVTNPMSEKITALEGKAHEHANKAELDKIADGDKAKWDAAVQTVTAGTGLTATKSGTDVAIAFDDSVTFIFDCGGAN